jgi:GTP cyclohydrolase IA
MIDKKKIQKAVRDILEAIGEDPEREGLKKTPERIAKFYEEVFSGLDQDPEKEISIFHNEENEEMIMVRDIPFYSMCEHHLVPFIGRAHIVYIPKKGHITGLSKLVKVLEVLAKRPQVQERLTSQVADTLMKTIDPHGVLVIIEAEHLCMSMRGVKKPGAVATTSAVRGVFMKNPTTRAEALSLLGKK